MTDSAASRASLAPGKVLHTSDAGYMGLQGNLMLIYATGQATRHVLDEAFAMHRSLQQRYPQGYGYLLVTRADAPMPSKEAREAFEQMDREFGGHLLASAMVIEGEGLLATTMRLVMRSMSLAFSRRYPMKYFAEPNEALTWLERQAGSEKHFDSGRVMQRMGRMPVAEARKVA